MTNKDLLHRFIFENTPIRGEFIHLEECFQTIVKQHPYPPALRKLLGEALCVAALLSAIIKFDGRLTVQFRGKGKLKLLLAQCDNNNHLRALVKWEGELSYEDLMDSFNEGVLVIMLDSEANTTRYQGMVAWQGNSLAESIEEYFKHSEQLETKICLAVNDTSAAGFLLQVVPTGDKNFSDIEKDIITPNWEFINRLTDNLNPSDMLWMDYQTLLRTLYPEEIIRVFPSVHIKFHCKCTRKRGEDAILVLGKKEADEELRNKNSIVVTCEFCNKEYVFDAIDVAAIFEKNNGHPPTDTHLH